MLTPTRTRHPARLDPPPASGAPPQPATLEALARLAPDQRAAATAPPGPILCVAPAGSGKTTTLVARVAWLLDRGASPGSICAVTFNRRAAEELAARLDQALAPLGQEPGAVRVRTFHALGREILLDAGRPVEPLVDRMALLEELAGDSLSPAELRRLDDGFSRLKLDLAVDPARLAAEASEDEAAGRPRRRIVDAFLRYEAALRARGAVDFDDLTRGALDALTAEPPLLTRWRAACRHLLVDEVQDLDRTQLRLALLLATAESRDFATSVNPGSENQASVNPAPESSIFLVGDDDQTIYAWRLADVRRVLGLAAELDGLRRLDLVTNYRCPAPVVRRALRLVEHNRERFAKTVRPRSDAHGQLVLAADPGDDAARARRLLASWPARRGESRAILARTNAELAPYAAVALEMGLPYRALDDGLLLDEPTLDRLLEEAVGLAEQRLEPMVQGSDPGAERRRPSEPACLLDELRRSLRPEDRQVAGALVAWSIAYADIPSLGDALRATRERRSTLRRDDAELVLATVHSTKGLEFDHVACIGLDEGRFPSARSIAEADDPDRALEEERRLAYVAWTRARRSLLLLYDPGAPSLFLREAFDATELAR